MNFGSASAKAWKDIWGAGQGVGAIKRVVPAAELVRRFAEEYALARRRLGLAEAGATSTRAVDVA
jgi:nitronate monooxygenase